MDKFILNEELFEESEQIQEAFSPSMPKWLAARLLYQDKYQGYLNQKQKDKMAKFVSKGYALDKQSKGYFSNRDYEEINLSKGFKIAGIDISKANFISGEVPKSASDPRLKNPNNVPIYHLVAAAPATDQVYAKGINDKEQFYANDKQFRYMSVKELLQNTVDFCYLDMTDENNFNKDLKQQRKDTKDELSQIPNYDRATVYKPGMRVSRNMPQDSYVDKSGYVVDPNRYKKKLAELGRQDISKTMDKVYKRLMNVKEECTRVLMDFDPKSHTGEEEFNNTFADRYDSIIAYLSNAIVSYNDIMAKIKEALSQPDEEQKEMMLDNIFGKGGMNGSIKRLYDYIDALEKKADRIAYAKLNFGEELEVVEEPKEEVEEAMEPPKDEYGEDWEYYQFGLYQMYTKASPDKIVKLYDDEYDKIPKDSVEVEQALTDLSQGTGNVLLRVYYSPLADKFYEYADF